MRKNKTLLFIISILVISGTFFALRSFGDEKKSLEKNPKKVAVEKITPAPFSPVGEYCGFSVGAKRTQVAPQIGGTIQKLLKNEGETVRAGEVIAILKDSTIESQRNSAFQVSQDTQEIQSDTKKLYAQKVDEAEANLKKTEKNFETGDASKEDVGIAEEAVKSAKRARDLQNSAAEMRTSEALGQFGNAQSYAEKQNVRAPFSGTITKKLSTDGSFVSPGTPIYSLSAPGETEIELSIAKEIIERLNDKQEVSLSDEKSDSSLTSIVYAKNSFSGSSKDPNGIIRLRIKDTLVEPGKYLCAQLPLEEKREALLVPERSILHEFGETFVFIAENNIVQKRKVSLGSNFSGKNEIVSGLNAGENLIIEGLHEIKDGAVITY